MKSNHPISNQRRQILSEDEYSSTLERIITRDYFPSVTSLQRDAAILQKRAEGDIAGAVAIRRAAREIDQQEEIAKLIDHEQELAATNGVRKRPRPLKEEDLSGFHTRVTSEDNAHFEKTMKEEAQVKKQMIDLMYNTKFSHHYLLKEQGEDKKLMNLSHDEQMKSRLDPTPLLASDEFNPHLQRINLAGGSSATTHNSFFFTPEHHPQKDSSTESLMLTCRDEHNCDSLMPPPSLKPQSGESSLPLHLIPHEYQSKQLTKDSKQKLVIPSNTRFDFQNESRLIHHSMGQSHSSIEEEYNHQSASMIRHNSESAALHYDTETSSATTDLDDVSLSSRDIFREREKRKQKLQQERNQYVTMTPIILPGQGRDSSPLLTFGRIASTPLVSSSQHDIYQLPEQDQRESIANKAQLQLKHKSNLYKSAGSSGIQPSMTPIMSSSIARLGGQTPTQLTPAAHKLLQRSNLSSSTTSSLTSNLNSNVRSASAFASALRSSYTPKSSSQSEKRFTTTNSSGNVNSSKLRHVFKATPLTNSADLNMEPCLYTKDGNRTETTQGLMKL